MNVYLLHRTRPFDFGKKLPDNEEELTRDLALEILLNKMAAEDDFILDICQKTILSYSVSDPETITYRQEILKDCLNNPDTVKSLYALIIDTLKKRKESWYAIFSKEPSSILSSAVGMMEIYITILKKLKALAEENQSRFQSDGFLRFFKMITEELTDSYFTEMENHLHMMDLPNGLSINGKLAIGNKGTDYSLTRSPERPRCWWFRLFPKKTKNYTFKINPRDNGGIKTLAMIRDKGLNEAANVLAQSVDHIFNFISTLRAELAFYLGCMNLHEKLSGLDAPISFPVVTTEKPILAFRDLYDISLSLSMDKKIVGNSLEAKKPKLIVITGANQGGKTTFLRSLGLAQIMMQAGMFVAAENYSGSLCTALFTHFKRKEDATMESGKFDEELSRMNQIIETITPKSMVLFNESFASTNEREGSEIAEQIVKALIEKDITVYFVTHLYAFAHYFYLKKVENTIFLRAERKPDGTRTFKVTEGEPLETSYGIDLYNKIFKN